MSDPAHPPTQRVLQLYATAPYPCSYLPDQQARSQVVLPGDAVDTQVYAQLLEKGFRRSGPNTYRPWCDGCQACVPLRVEVHAFVPDRSQRRAWKQHCHLNATCMPLDFRSDHFALYKRYQEARHSGGSMDNDNEDDYRNFILHSGVDAMLVEFRDADRALKMVALIDVLPDAFSAVYTFYADDAHASYGTYAVLWQIAHARQSGRRHVYLGYWVRQSRKMAYKTRFRPHEILQADGWQTGSMR